MKKSKIEITKVTQIGEILRLNPNVKDVLTLNGVNYYLTSCDMVKNKLIEIL